MHATFKELSESLRDSIEESFKDKLKLEFQPPEERLYYGGYKSDIKPRVRLLFNGEVISEVVLDFDKKVVYP